MKIHKKYLLNFAFGLAVIGILWFVVQALFAYHDVRTLGLIDEQVAAERAVLVYVADLTRQNGVDEATNKIVADCNGADRQRFDSLLDQLSKTISQSELTELTTLFGKCSNFYAERKSIMAARLSLEVQRYTVLKNLRNAIRVEKGDTMTELTAWQQVADAEQKWSDYFSELVTHQGTIITLLSNGKRATSPEVVAVLSDVKSAREQMEILGIQIQGYRETIAKL
jgi:hypothetical protein